MTIHVRNFEVEIKLRSLRTSLRSLQTNHGETNLLIERTVVMTIETMLRQVEGHETHQNTGDG